MHSILYQHRGDPMFQLAEEYAQMARDPWKESVTLKEIQEKMMQYIVNHLYAHFETRGN